MEEARQVWQAALGALELQVTRANFQTWLKNTVGISLNDKQMVVGVPNAFAKEWLEKRLLHLIEKTLGGLLGRPVEVQFQVCSNRATGTEFGHPCFNPKYTFSSFIVGNSNRLAHAAALGVAENPGQAYNPLFIYGGVGLGKTHLLHAIGHVILQSTDRVIYVTAEQFTNEFITAIRERSTEQFRNKYRGVDALLIDDIQFIMGKEQTQEGLFHTFNDLHNANRQIVLTSDRPPKALSLLEDRLRSRFEWGLIVDIQPPDLETRLAILQAKAREKRLELPQEVLYFIAKRVQTNIRELEGALNRITAYAHLVNAPITTDLAAQALLDITTSEAKRTLTPEAVISCVARYFNLSPEALKGRRRDKPVALARQIAMYLLREEMECSWTEIGRYLGGKDHSTVLHGYQKIANEAEVSPALRQDILEIRESLYKGTDAG